eukprot:CAMPEP_0115071228 /NCGR_PEP_ID=MMETSP0227-20121206/13554_1 /TAXON_ID=89957 /ORGANISM="Polarella glacialis, Strain CCMP 1383" /LENGTH=53 /DNA_ID=CAMNT_0002457833 /DNA_START=1015 /DNA_END=1176 /DNA_ORIENTATION=-
MKFFEVRHPTAEASQLKGVNVLLRAWRIQHGLFEMRYAGTTLNLERMAPGLLV